MGPDELSDPAWLHRFKKVPFGKRILVVIGTVFVLEVCRGILGGWRGWLVGLVASGGFVFGVLSWLAMTMDTQRDRLVGTIGGALGGAVAGGITFVIVYAVDQLNAAGWPTELEGDAATPWALLFGALIGGWTLLGGLIGVTTKGKRGIAIRTVMAVAGMVGGVAAGGTMCFLVYIVAIAAKHGGRAP